MFKLNESHYSAWGQFARNEIITEQMSVMNYLCVAIQSLMNLTSEGYILKRTSERRKERSNERQNGRKKENKKERKTKTDRRKHALSTVKSD